MEEEKFVCAIDLGALQTVVVKASLRTVRADVCRNELGKETTPSVLSFSSQGARNFGEVAAQGKVTNRLCTVEDPWLLDEVFDGFSASSISSVGKFDEKGCLEVVVAGEEHVLSQVQILAMFLKHFSTFKSLGEEGEPVEQPVAVVLPDNFDLLRRHAVRDAAKIANINLVSLITRCEAAAMHFASRKSADELGESAAMIVDIGHKYASACVCKFKGKEVDIVSQDCVRGAGGAAIESKLFDALCLDLKERKGAELTPGSKGALRLQNQVRKLKESLSAVPHASVTCESLLEDEDVNFEFSRQRLEELCQTTIEEVKTLLKGVLDACEEETRSKVSEVEIIGGGIFAPFIRSAVDEAIHERKLQTRLDPISAVATGAALHLARLFEPEGAIVRPVFENLARVKTLSSEDGPRDEIQGLMTDSEIQQAAALEETFSKLDEKIARIHSAKNKLESKVLEARALASEGSKAKFSELIRKGGCREVAEKFENVLWEAPEDSSAEVFEKMLEEFEAELEPHVAEYNLRVAQDAAQRSKEMEEDAAKAAAEIEAGGGKQDYDDRPLRKEDRLRKVNLNKNEGNSLFKDGNYDAASKRYMRALQHCDKFIDLKAKEDEEEVAQIRKTLLLNSAQCFLKLEDWKSAKAKCEEALKIEPDSVKGLFRLAFAMENMKEFREARKHLKRGLELEPDDKALQKLLARVEAQIKREETKAKKMAQKMFG